ncbi:response regulator transcription factor [Kosakonia oryziphila]|uniref:Two component transcriptional regulator, LuxR family n=1 Tax=Kosakonia oryziphila TaxID=1005667 RepID=A0A1C4CRL2_9ENTR|nr:response regulator transcription factor [Kosakonia oryziphila]SCC21601.1 two component transcriptional regulator, LuxR family [Kosakonia oryziphila]
MKALHVVLLDDHQVVLAGMKDYLDQVPGVQVDATFSTSSELINNVRKQKPDVIITDYSMPKDDVYTDGMKLIAYLLRTFPDVKILVLTMISNQMIVSALYDAGVTGVIFKQDNLSEVLSALMAVRANTRYYPPSFKTNMGVDEHETTLRDRINNLSPREYEVLRHFVAGESISQIAEKLNRSAKTVSIQKNAAMRKLNVDNNQELIRYCVENNIFV